MRPRHLLIILAGIALVSLTSCEPGVPLTVSGFYKATDGSKAGISTTFTPRIHAEK